MVRTIMVAVLLVLAATPVIAASPCPSGVPLNTYLTPGFTCQVADDYIATNFVAKATAAMPNVPVNPSQVTVVVVDDTNGSGFHLVFPPAFMASGGKNDLEFDWTATALPGYLITGIYSRIDGKQINGASGTTLSQITEMYCAGPTGWFNPPDTMCNENGGIGGYINLQVVTGTNSTTRHFSTPQTKIAVQKDIEIIACNSGGWCGSEQITDVFNQLGGTNACVTP